MAEELTRPQRFEARLVVKSTNVNLSALDELRNLKTIDITIRVNASDSGNVWTWNASKFENRLFMMREIYQEYLEYGPREIPKSKDPFWDPPEAIEIGKSYVYLKALSQLVEIENDFSIVDYKGDEQGQLHVEVFPEGINGEDLDYLATSEEIIGTSVIFSLRITDAKNVPSKYSNDVYVTFTFHDQSMETPPCEQKTTNPKWDFEHKLKFENITEDFRQYLLKDAAEFIVKGFTDSQIQETKAAKLNENPVIGSWRMCQQCEEKPATGDCRDCNLIFCDNCFGLLHKSAKKAGHTRIQLDEHGEAVAPAVHAGNCVQCDENAAVVQCVDCDKKLCDGCNGLLHKSAKKAEHNRQPLAGGAATAAAAAAAAPAGGGDAVKCQQCDENAAIVRCADCDKAFCDGCNNLLHKSARKAGHARTPL
jgi:hypothetical protein